jgi:hypothetical protein
MGGFTPGSWKKGHHSMHDDCVRLAADFYDFAAHYMPNYIPELEQAA